MSDMPKIGQIFDSKYRIQDALGSGGNGVVFKAVQLDCKRTVALKILYPGSQLNSEYYQARFLREAQGLGKLSHPNIVVVYHIGISASNLSYLAMEFVEGESVRGVLNRLERIPVLQALSIARDTALAMAYVHSADIIHRDLKPDNIMLTELPNPDTVKLVDFGLIKLPEQSEQKLTGTGQLVGSIKYMSPEQCAGKPLNFSTDVYSLSCTLYEMLTGVVPFDADNPVGLAYKHIHDPAPEIKPEQVDVFDPVLNEIIHKGMSKSPERRFESMEAMAAFLDESIRIVAISGTKSMSDKPQKKHSLKFWSLAAACTLLLGGLILFLTFNLSQKKAEPSPKIITTTATINPKELELHNKQQLLSRYEKKYGPNHRSLVRYLYDLSAAMVDPLTNLHYEVEASAYLERALAIREKYPQDSNPSLEKILEKLSACYREIGKPSEAIALAKRAIELRKFVPEPSEGTSHLYGLLASCYNKIADYSNEELALRRSLALAEGFAAPIKVVDIHNAIGSCLTKQGKSVEARKHFETSLAILEGEEKNALDHKANHTIDFLLTSNHKSLNGSKLATFERNKRAVTQYIGDCYAREGNYAAAEKYYEKLFLASKLQSEADREYSLGLLINCCLKQGKYDKAIMLQKSVLAAREQRLPSSELAVAETSLSIARTMKEKGDYAAALPLFSRALSLSKKNLPGDHPQVKLILSEQAECQKQIQSKQSAAGKSGNRESGTRESGT